MSIKNLDEYLWANKIRKKFFTITIPIKTSVGDPFWNDNKSEKKGMASLFGMFICLPNF